MKVVIINGPNLNLLGVREKSIYGEQSFEEYIKELRQTFPSIIISFFQSNVEGEIINYLHENGLFIGNNSIDISEDLLRLSNL